jgi:hypothetical protein
MVGREFNFSVTAFHEKRQESAQQESASLSRGNDFACYTRVTVGKILCEIQLATLVIHNLRGYDVGQVADQFHGLVQSPTRMAFNWVEVTEISARRRPSCNHERPSGARDHAIAIEPRGKPKSTEENNMKSRTFTHSCLFVLALIVMATTGAAYAQEDVTTDGTAQANQIPLWTSSTNIEGSELSQNTGNTTITASGTLGSAQDLRVDVDGKNDASQPGATHFVSPGLRFGKTSTAQPTGEAITSQRVTCTSTGCTNNINGLDLDTDFVARVSITNGGNVGIQTRTPTNIFTILQGGGDAIADGWSTYSSRRFKTNIQTLDGALEKVEQLRGVSYDSKATGKHEVGVIAEEVGVVVPEIVSWNTNGTEAKGVDYSRLTALLIEATKEQQTLIHQQQQQIEAQQEEIALLASKMKAVEASIKTGDAFSSEIHAVKVEMPLARE